MPASTIGQRIKTARLAAGMTQEQLAAAAGLHEQSISKIELGVKQPLGSTVLAIAKALKVSTDQLLGRQPAPAGKGAA